MKKQIAKTIYLATNLPIDDDDYQDEYHKLVIHFTEDIQTNYEEAAGRDVSYDSCDVELDFYELDGKEISSEDLLKKFDRLDLSTLIEEAISD